MNERMNKELAIVGLGKMGANMARRMMEKGWTVVGMDRDPETVKKLEAEGLKPAGSYKEMSAALKQKRIVWLFLPPQKIAGEEQIVDQEIFGENGIADSLSPGDTIIDGGNSFYKYAATRAKRLEEKGIHFMDAGTSGGPAGARNGACLMIGGSEEGYADTEHLFKDFAKEGAYKFFPGAGAGHFVKMVHNGIEYGMMQAIGEGFEVLKKSPFDINLEDAAEIYNNGSVIESRLVGWTQSAFKEHGPALDGISSTVQHNGEGAWTIQAAKELGVEVPVIKASFQFRIDSAEKPSFTGKVVSAQRGQFGGHSVKEEKSS